MRTMAESDCDAAVVMDVDPQLRTENVNSPSSSTISNMQAELVASTENGKDAFRDNVLLSAEGTVASAVLPYSDFQKNFSRQLKDIIETAKVLPDGNTHNHLKSTDSSARMIEDGSEKIDSLIIWGSVQLPYSGIAEKVDNIRGVSLFDLVTDPLIRHLEISRFGLSYKPISKDSLDGNSSLISEDLPTASTIEYLESSQNTEMLSESAECTDIKSDLMSENTDMKSDLMSDNMDMKSDLMSENTDMKSELVSEESQSPPSPKSQASEQTENAENGKENPKKRKYRESISRNVPTPSLKEIPVLFDSVSPTTSACQSSLTMEPLLSPHVGNKSVTTINTPKRRRFTPLYTETNPYPLKQLAREAFIIVNQAKEVCIVCLNDTYEPENDERLLKCHGPCRRTFHYQCCDVEDERNVTGFLCHECETGERKCFVCGDVDENLVMCPVADCGKFYHFKCLMGESADSTTKLIPCPQHSCHTCRLNGRTAKMPKLDKGLVKCNKCPYACHFNFMCCPAEVRVCPDNPAFLTCWKHEERAKSTKKSKKRASSVKQNSMMAKNCLYCNDGGTLLVCDQCPFVAHQACLQLETVPDGPWTCPECTKGRKPMLLDIVWHKCGIHRVWPCQILPESIVPDVIQKKHPGGNAFVMRFLGTKEFTYATPGEVLPYDICDPGWKKAANRNANFPEALIESKQKAEELLRIKEEFVAATFQGVPPVFRQIKGNLAILPAKYGRQQIKKTIKKSRDTSYEDDNICNCSPEDNDPCGPMSDCVNRGVHFECNPKTCPAGKMCGNQRLLKRNYPRLKKFYTADRGWALRAEEDIVKRSVVIEYVGEIITVEERNRRIREKLKTGDVNFYFLDLTKGRVIDAGPSGNLARFANHSCNANCASEKWEVDGDTRIGLIALRNISKGEEITFDYRWEYEYGVTCRECLCGAENCRGKIGGKTYTAKVSVENGSGGSE